MWLHRAVRTDTLADGLAELLATPLGDPFAPEIVAVPAKGVERWLNQRLCTRLGAQAADGIAANIDYPNPARLVDDVIAAVSGTAAGEDPWEPTRLVWTVLDTVDASLSEPWSSTLARHLGAGTDEHRVGRRFATATHIVDLFVRYGAQRPAMLVDWARGRDTDGVGESLPDDLIWQAELWRRVRARLAVPSLAERLDTACAALRDDPALVELPERVSLFGPTRLSTVALDVLSALSVKRDVHLWIPHPSPQLWRALSGQPRAARRSRDATALAVHHPLLAGLGRDVRELQHRLEASGVRDRLHEPASSAPTTLLQTLQQDIAADRVPAGTARADGTVVVHACHGPARQVEVLRDCVLQLFETDPTLEPRDVLVMCPDIETFAPLIQAAFGQGISGHPAHRLRVRLADRALRQVNPLLDAMAMLLDLADGRVTASQVIDLGSSVAVRGRFGFDDEDLERLREWVTETGSRWGIGSRQRAAFGLEDFAQNTVNTGVDRLLLGAAADESDWGWLGLALPLGDVESTDIDLAGRFAEFVDRLAVVLRELQGPQPVSVWVAVLRRALELLTFAESGDEWQLAQAHREIVEATEYGDEQILRLPDLRAMLAQRLAGRPTRSNFRTGELTVCTMVPMRSVPHRVVVLLGLDDDVFPRTGASDGDDVLLRDPCVGERDPRSEDRQLLLDAVLAAEDRLLLFYTGADPVTGVPRPPAIPLSELIDTVRATAESPVPVDRRGSSRGDAIVRRQPLQPFDPANFDAAEPFSFDRDALAGARASVTAKRPVPALLSAPLAALPDADVDLAELIAFVVHPVQAFLWQRLGVRVPQPDDDVTDAIGIELAPLEKWSIGDRMLAARLAGVSPADFRGAEWRRGTLPPFALGAEVLDGLQVGVDALVDAVQPLYERPASALDVAVDLGGGRQLTGTVTDLRGDVLTRAVYSRLGAKHRLSAWVQLLAVAAHTGSSRWVASTTGRGRGTRPAWRSTLSVPTDPMAELVRLVDLRDRGLREPLPFAPKASCAYAERRCSGGSSAEAGYAADREWTGEFGDGNDRHLGYVVGRGLDSSKFGSEPPDPAETPGTAEPSRFGALACRLWAPLLDAETQGQP